MNWNKCAEGATQWCLRTLWDGDAKLFRPASPPDAKSLPWEFMWGNGVAFSMLVGATRHAPTVYRPYLDAFFQGMEGYWCKRGGVYGYNAYLSKTGDDRYYDDNDWMAIAFAEACVVTRNKIYRGRAEETLRFVLSGWDDKAGGGIYWREDHRSKNTCANAPAATAASGVATRA